MSDEPRRLRIRGIHHITLLVASLERSSAFYRNVLGMSVAAQTVSDDDEDARHLFFGDDHGTPGTLVTCLEYPELDPGSTGVGSTHHFALNVGGDDELDGWHEYLTANGVECTPVMQRTGFRSLYVRDPDGHIVELASDGSVAAPH